MWRPLALKLIIFGGFVCLSHNINVCRNECNDGGCAYTDKGGNYKGCDCRISRGIRTGSECELYVNSCHNSGCSKYSECHSILGRPFCACPIGRENIHCSQTHNRTNVIQLKKPSIFYQTKVRPGEKISNTNLVIGNDESFKFELTFTNEATGLWMNLNNRDIMTVDNFYSICMTMMINNDFIFTMNINLCEQIKTIYDGYSTVMVMEIISYYIPKTKLKRTAVYFNEDDHSEGRMGGLYKVNIQIIDDVTKVLHLSYDVHHLAVDDELSYCLPFVDPGKNCRNNSIQPLTIKRNNDVPVINMIITPDTEVCNETMEYIYTWTIYDAMDESGYNVVLTNIQNDFFIKKIVLDNHTSSNQDLKISKYTLPEGNLIADFKLRIKNERNDFKNYASNRYMCNIMVILEGLHAEILGSSVKRVSNVNLVTLDASLSHNPNEPNNRQNDILYVWSCNVITDVNNCQEYITTDPIRRLMAPLDKAKTYVFKLITRVSDEYRKRVGNPKTGTAKITLLPISSIIYDARIKCLKNCVPLSSPLEIIYLLVDTNCKNCSFEWQYKEKSGSQFISAENIRQSDKTPYNVFITKKLSLDYNKMYIFQVKDSSYELESSIVIKTAAKPTAGECHANPNSGIAGMTLFTITCSKFQDVYGDNSLLYMYYEQYENDENGYGLLISHGSNKAHNVKLSHSGKLNILALNSFGMYAYVNISIQIFKSSTNELVKMFRSMKVELLNGNTSGTVHMLSVISDIFLDNKITTEFSILFDTILLMSKIPPKGCVFVLEQITLVLKKVVHACSVVNNHKITPTDALKISTNILFTVSNLFEYLKALQNKEIAKEVEHIQRIYNSLKIIIDILIGEIDPIVYKNHSENTTRYFRSSSENMVLMIKNFGETLEMFGESTILYQLIHENPKTYESKESSFRTYMLNDDMLKKHPYIGSDLGNELTLNINSRHWGFKIFDVYKNLIHWTEPGNNDAMSNVKYVALSAHDQFNSKYFGMINKFLSPASIIFDINETVDKMYDKEYVISVPSADSAQIEFDKSILVFRLDMMKIGAIFVTIRNTPRPLLVTWTRDRRPDFEMMNNKQNAIRIPTGEDYSITLKTHKDQQNDIHYIGIFADTSTNNTLSNNSYEIKFNMNVVCMRCLYWKYDSWSLEGMEIGPNSSVETNNVHCFTYHFSLFTSSIFAPPDLLNPFDEIYLFSTIADNMVCLLLVIIIFAVYFVLLYWSHVQDKNDIIVSRIIILDDNYVGEDEVYIVTVYTGHGIGSGTTANVCIELNGTIRNSRAHWLCSSHYQTLQRSNDDWFLIFTPRSLGELESIHIWHDNFGESPDWFCQRIIVTEVRTNKIWVFEVHRWLSLRHSSDNIEYFIYFGSFKHNWRKEIKEQVGSGIRESHMWASVFIRHPRSPITRCQRLSVILCVILSMMFSSMVFYQIIHSDEEQFQKYELKMREIVIAIQSGLVETILTYSVHMCFEKGREVQLNKVMHARIQKKEIPNNEYQSSTLNKIFQIVIGHMAEKNVYYPINTETIEERHQWNNWFISGWFCCIVVYIISAFYIVLYGLKFGRIKSLCWLTSILIGILQGVIIFKPFKIILTSAVKAKFILEPKDKSMTYTYKLTLGRYRKKKLMFLQNVKYVQLIRKNRKRFIYAPLTGKAVDVLRSKKKRMSNNNDLRTEILVCAIFILTSLTCLYVLNVFHNQNEIYITNRMTSIYLEGVFLSNDGHTMITLDDLTKLLSYNLLKALNSLEMYNGVSISNDTTETKEHDKRGWFGLYNSRLIGGGLRFRQKRVKLNDENDNHNYGPGWTTLDDNVKTNDTINAPWIYSRQSSHFGIMKNPFAVDDSGYKLNLTGGLVKSKFVADEYLKSKKWLDPRTRRLYVEFQMYTPNTDSVTVVEARMSTECGLYYTISRDEITVNTVPMDSVVADWDTYVFTVFAVFSLTGATLAFLLMCAFRRLGHKHQRWTSTAYDVLLVALAVATMMSLYQRLQVMEYYDDKVLAVATTEYVNLTPACHAHTACVTYAAALTATALLKISKLQWTDVGDWSLVVAGAVIVAAATISGAYVTADVLFTGGLVLFLFNAVYVVNTRSSKNQYR